MKPYIVWKRTWLTAVSLVLAALFGSQATASPWESLFPFQQIEADPDVTYWLTAEHGPWLILTSSFAGPGAQEQAEELVLELRKTYKLRAYIHKQHFDYTEPVIGQGVDSDTLTPGRRMRYKHASKFDQFSVLVGDFDSVEDPQAQKVLKKIKYAYPECLKVEPGQFTAQRLAVLREIQRRLSPERDRQKQGPMAKAFVTRNPLLPEEYFAPEGLDQFVLDMNKDVPYSLLENPGKYTVRVATFRGHSTMNLNQIRRLQESRQASDKLEEAAVKAHKLTMALRQKGVEAYEFHDRYESIVTIGSFDSLGLPQANGQIELHPPILKIMDGYGANQASLPGQQAALVPRQLEGVPFDVQPIPVLVPRRSIAADYASGKRFLGF